MNDLLHAGRASLVLRHPDVASLPEDISHKQKRRQHHLHCPAPSSPRPPASVPSHFKLGRLAGGQTNRIVQLRNGGSDNIDGSIDDRFSFNFGKRQTRLARKLRSRPVLSPLVVVPDNEGAVSSGLVPAALTYFRKTSDNSGLANRQTVRVGRFRVGGPGSVQIFGSRGATKGSSIVAQELDDRGSRATGARALNTFFLHIANRNQSVGTDRYRKTFDQVNHHLLPSALSEVSFLSAAMSPRKTTTPPKKVVQNEPKESEERNLVTDDCIAELPIPWRTSRRLQEATYRMIQERDGGHATNTASASKQKFSGGKSTKREQWVSSDSDMESSEFIEGGKKKTGKKRKSVHFSDPLVVYIDDKKQSSTGSPSKASSPRKGAEDAAARENSGQAPKSISPPKQILSCFDLLCNHVGPKGWRCYRTCFEGSYYCYQHQTQNSSIVRISVCT
ncbi:hypothetical protein R1flu_006111 [Riccia fluitans]|uniref:Uncharacterized protein n=1 Tax=Riccia fluitans TaxID=41844 RepID=A0ABD1YY47_9MARC